MRTQFFASFGLALVVLPFGLLLGQTGSTNAHTVAVMQQDGAGRGDGGQTEKVDEVEVKGNVESETVDDDRFEKEDERLPGWLEDAKVRASGQPLLPTMPGLRLAPADRSPVPENQRFPVSETRMVEEFTADGKRVYRPFTITSFIDVQNVDAGEDRQAVELARRYRATKDEEAKKEIRAAIRAMTEATFKKRLEARVKQLEEAQAKLDKIKAELDQRRELEDKIVARRIGDLLDDPDPTSWEFNGIESTTPYEIPTYPVIPRQSIPDYFPPQPAVAPRPSGR